MQKRWRNLIYRVADWLIHIASKDAPEPHYGDLLLNGAQRDENGEWVWNVMEVIEIVEPLYDKGKIYSYIVKARGLRHGGIACTQVCGIIWRYNSYTERSGFHVA